MLPHPSKISTLKWVIPESTAINDHLRKTNCTTRICKKLNNMWKSARFEDPWKYRLWSLLTFTLKLFENIHFMRFILQPLTFSKIINEFVCKMTRICLELCINSTNYRFKYWKISISKKQITWSHRHNGALLLRCTGCRAVCADQPHLCAWFLGMNPRTRSSETPWSLRDPAPKSTANYDIETK